MFAHRPGAAFIPDDAWTKVGSDALLGNKIIVLYGGEGEPPLPAGAVLRAAEAVSTDDMLAMLQANNENLLAVTSQLRHIAEDLAEGRDTAGRILADDALYDDLRVSASRFGEASSRAEALAAELQGFAGKLDREGSLPNDLATDTETYGTLVASVQHLAAISQRAEALVTALDAAAKDPNSAAGTLLAEPEAAADLRATLDQLDEGSRLLAEDLEALQHSILLRGWFRKRAKQAERDAADRD